MFTIFRMSYEVLLIVSKSSALGNQGAYKRAINAAVIRDRTLFTLHKYKVEGPSRLPGQQLRWILASLAG